MSHPLVVWGTKDLNTSAQLVLAKRLGFFKQLGLEVQCKLFPSEQRLLHAFHSTDAPPLAWAQTVPEILRPFHGRSTIGMGANGSRNIAPLCAGR